MQSLIGIDLGGTKIEIAVVDPIKGITYKDRVHTPRHSYTAILDAICALVDKTLVHQDLEPPLAIGIGIPGCLDPATQLVRGSNTCLLYTSPSPRDS